MHHVLDGVQIAPCEWAIFRGKDMPGHPRRHSAVSCAKMAEPIETPFELWTPKGSMCYMGAHTGATWRIRLNRPCAAAMWPLLVNYFERQKSEHLLWPPCVADADIIFSSCGIFFLSSFFRRLISAVGDWMSTIHVLIHMVWP